MKGVVLAGGLGSRLYPLTYATNKHLLPVYDKPMIYYPIQTLVRAGIDDILIVVGGPHAGDFMAVLRNGKDFGIRHLEYAYQENEGGIAQALSLCEDFADNGNLAVILGDNTTDADIRPAVEAFQAGACIFLKQVPDPKRFGVPVFDEHDPQRIVRIEEKPTQPKSRYAVTGLYLYDAKVFNYIPQIKPSGRGELEISDVNNFYISAGKMTWVELQGFWSDAGTFESLYRTNRFWAEKKLGAVHGSGGAEGMRSRGAGERRLVELSSAPKHHCTFAQGRESIMSKATVKARPYETIAKLLHLDAQNLERDSLRLYLRHQLRCLDAGIFTISRRYGVQTVEDMEQLYEERKLSEKDSWEDFFELDHLEAEREAVKKALEAL